MTCDTDWQMIDLQFVWLFVWSLKKAALLRTTRPQDDRKDYKQQVEAQSQAMNNASIYKSARWYLFAGVGCL